MLALNSIRAGSLGSFSPTQLGTVLSWVKGDNATMDGDSVVYTSLTDSGTLGGTFDSATNAAPIAVSVGGRNAAAFRGTRRASSSVGLASFIFLHDSTGDATITIRFYLYDTGGDYRVYTTSAGGAAPGVRIRISGSKAVAIWSNASADALTLTSVADVAVGWNTIQITKSNADCGLILNGETSVTGTIGTPSSANPSHAPYLGNTSTGTGAANGLIAEMVIHGTVLDATGLAQMRSYMSSRWSATPDYSPIQGSADLIQWLDASKGITIATGISAWADQSGYNNDVVQATAGRQPAFTASAINGLPGSTGDGTDDYLNIAAFTNGTIAQPVTRYVSGKIDTWVSSAHVVSSGAGAARCDLNLAAAPTLRVDGYDGANFTQTISGTTGTDLDGVPFVWRAVYNNPTSRLRLLFDGHTEESTGDTASGGQGLAGTCIHGIFGVAWSASTICESMVFSGTAGSNTAASDVHDVYLRDKYTVAP